MFKVWFSVSIALAFAMVAASCFIGVYEPNLIITGMMFLGLALVSVRDAIMFWECKHDERKGV